PHVWVPPPAPPVHGTCSDADKLSGDTPAADSLLDFFLTLPATGGPHRVVMLQHGFAGDNNFGLTAANESTAVSHGRRGNVFDLLSATPLQVRDIFRQTNADQMAVARAIQAGI